MAHRKDDHEGTVTPATLDAQLARTIAPIEKAIASAQSDLSWHKWLLFALTAAVFSPKIGGPGPAAVTQSAVHLVAAVNGSDMLVRAVMVVRLLAGR